MKKFLTTLLAFGLSSHALAINKKVTYRIMNSSDSTADIKPYIRICPSLFVACGNHQGPTTQVTGYHPPIAPGATQTFTTEMDNWNEDMVPFVYQVDINGKSYPVKVNCFGYQNHTLTISLDQYTQQIKCHLSYP